MGFPGVFYALVMPRLFLHLLFSLAYIKRLILLAVHFMGFPGPLQVLMEFSSAEDVDSDLCSSQDETFCAEMIKMALPELSYGSLSSSRKIMSQEGEEQDENEEAMCTVCLNSFKSEDNVRELMVCSHVFHSSCIDQWLDHSHTTCPLCRCPVLPDSSSEQLIMGQASSDSASSSTSPELWLVDRISYVFAEDFVHPN